MGCLISRPCTQQAKEAALPEEPPASVIAQVVTCVLRFPDGSRVSRRFRTSDLLQTLFDFTDAKVGFKQRRFPFFYCVHCIMLLVL